MLDRDGPGLADEVAPGCVSQADVAFAFFPRELALRPCCAARLTSTFPLDAVFGLDDPAAVDAVTGRLPEDFVGPPASPPDFVHTSSGFGISPGSADILLN